MGPCLCKSSLREGQGGDGHAFHPLYFFLSCPLHPTSSERLRQFEIHQINFEPPVIRIWSLDDYFPEAVEYHGHELSEPFYASDASSSPEQSGNRAKAPASLRPQLASVAGEPLDLGCVKERQKDSPETGLVDKASFPHRALDSVPTTAPGQRFFPDEDDWERYKSVIEDLYMRKSFSLAQVRNVMESNYGIKATYVNEQAPHSSTLDLKFNDIPDPKCINIALRNGTGRNTVPRDIKQPSRLARSSSVPESHE